MSKQQSDLKKSKKNIWQLKNIIFEIKISMEGFNNRLDRVEKRINELEDRSEGIIQNAGQRDKQRESVN